ncbi:5'-methylthioadenosine/adenosylhomocysteine nucleosidase [Vagococcus intermedius]|uniref:5'-methylthioadenosine/S-adenosylhomocysteine nucleosidase n=1 Tax=Vagococcus intermedius TaxID=2991418 RepID=A0AAF0I955_9ENTE|nr:5'-methylthioadenosine/adenosylhomocysteine nucleosidase [Vagococcus intermedius]WEG73142.1 5'-methylthioadenosine/adenosylhomocysteine nucleosidase [Vagococcus intermedius]WEG75226.1 5'-methylthioadenosine/adenosylhomocysteine nucleosidase [Vagococcus intermedius]
MKIGIIGAMAEELRLLRQEMTEMTEWTEAGATFVSGKLAGKEVVAVQSGIGKVLAALTTTLLISHYKVDAVINTGSAGGIGEGLAIGDVVVSTRLAYFDADVTAFGYEMGQMAGMPLYYEADSKLVWQAKAAAEAKKLSVKTGLIVSGDTFVNSQDKIERIKSYFPDVLANEMEGAAIAHVAHQYKVPFVVVRAMSDVGDEEASVNFDDFILEAGRKSAEMVVALVSEMA